MKVAFCDDSKKDILFYSGLVSGICRRYEIALLTEEYADGKQLLFELEDQSWAPDLIYLDIGMPGQSGMETARQLRASGCGSEIIFLTVSDVTDTILRAFDVDAFNYIIKKKTGEQRFEDVFLRACERCRSKKQETLLFSCAGESRRVAVRDISYFEVRNHCIAVHYGSETFEFYSTIGKVENILSRYGFVRVHRSFLAAAGKILRYTGNQITLRDGSVIPEGRSYQKQINEVCARTKVG